MCAALPMIKGRPFPLLGTESKTLPDGGAAPKGGIPMTLLSIHLMGLRAAAATVGSEVLVGMFQCIYGQVVEMAQTYGGQVRPEEGQDLLVLWEQKTDGSAPRTACRASWDLLRRMGRLQVSLVREHGVRLNPRAGLATDAAESADGEPQPDTLSRAQILQRASSLLGTSILLDGLTAAGANEGMELREIDQISATDPGILAASETRERTGIYPLDLAAFEGMAGSIHELLGPKGEVPPGRLGAALAFRGGLELYRQGELQKAAAVLKLLAHAPRPDPIARLYLARCQAEEAPLAS